MEKNKMNTNSGQLPGGDIRIGDHSNSSPNNKDTEEISKLIDELVAKLNTSEVPIHDKSDIISSIQTLKSEVNKEKPSKITLMSIGKTILENLKYVKEIAPFVHSIWDRIATMITR